MEENKQNQNAGNPPGGDAGTPDPGTPASDPPVDPGTPDVSGGEDPDPRDTTIANQKVEIKKLNRAVVDTRREGRANQGKEGEYTPEVLATPEGQYAASLEVADGRLRSGLEKRLKLYPEISKEMTDRIRTNPWAFASPEAWKRGDYKLALDEIELALLKRADEIEAEGKAKKPDPQDSPEGDPANVTGNPAPESEGDKAGAGSDEDSNLWTMPLPKLEKLAKKQLAELSQKK